MVRVPSEHMARSGVFIIAQQRNPFGDRIFVNVTFNIKVPENNNDNRSQND